MNSSSKRNRLGNGNGMAAAAVVCAVGERTGLLNIMWAVTTNDSRVMMMETMLSTDDTIIS